MSPDRNVEALKSVYARWAIGDFWTPEIFDPDVEVVWAEPMPDATRTARGISAMTFHDGKATRIEGFVDQADALEAVGLGK